MDEQIDRLARNLKQCVDAKEQAILVLEYMVRDLNCPWNKDDMAQMYESVSDRFRREGMS